MPVPTYIRNPVYRRQFEDYFAERGDRVAPGMLVTPPGLARGLRSKMPVAPSPQMQAAQGVPQNRLGELLDVANRGSAVMNRMATRAPNRLQAFLGQPFEAEGEQVAVPGLRGLTPEPHFTDAARGAQYAADRQSEMDFRKGIVFRNAFNKAEDRRARIASRKAGPSLMDFLVQTNPQAALQFAALNQRGQVAGAEMGLRERFGMGQLAGDRYRTDALSAEGRMRDATTRYGIDAQKTIAGMKTEQEMKEARIVDLREQMAAPGISEYERARLRAEYEGLIGRTPSAAAPSQPVAPPPAAVQPSPTIAPPPAGSAPPAQPSPTGIFAGPGDRTQAPPAPQSPLDQAMQRDINSFVQSGDRQGLADYLNKTKGLRGKALEDEVDRQMYAGASPAGRAVWWNPFSPGRSLMELRKKLIPSGYGY